MDDYRKQNSDYEPNFILKDTEGQSSGQDGQQSNDQSGSYAGQQAGGQAFRDPRESFRERSQAQSAGQQPEEPWGTDLRNSFRSQDRKSDDSLSEHAYRDPRDHFKQNMAGNYTTADGAETYSSGYAGGSGSWDSKHGFGKMKKEKKPKDPSRPITFTRKSLALFIALCLVVSGLFGAGGAVLANTFFDNSPSSNKTASASTTGYKLEDATGSNMTVQEITEAAKASVVEIKTESVSSDAWMQQYVTEGAGSGVIITNDGYIVTNNHVIDGASKITVTTVDEKEYEAELIGTDSITDVAVLKIDAKGLTPATYGNSSQLAVGDLAVAIGNPLGELGGTVTAGIISALDRQLAIDGKTMTLLQTDSSINPGNSGGGLFNGDGQLIGIVVAKSSGSDVEGLGFAIPINTAADVAQQIMDKGYVSGQPSTGMTYVESSGQQSGMDQFFSGGQSSTNVYIYSVDGTNAKNAGFQKGDMVSAVDGTEVTSFNVLSSIITSHKVGDKLKFLIVRNGTTMDITLKLEEKTAEQ